MKNSIVYVDGNPFIGRIEEQSRFIHALLELKRTSFEEKQPYIFLLYGDGGMGKTTLLKRFHQVAIEKPFRDVCSTLLIDWEYERNQNIYLASNDSIQPITVSDAINKVAIRTGEVDLFANYEEIRHGILKVNKEVRNTIESAKGNEDYAPIRGVATEIITEIVADITPYLILTGTVPNEVIISAFLKAGITVSLDQGQKILSKLQARINSRIGHEKFRLFLYPEENLALAMAKDLKKASIVKPFVVFWDTYEVIDHIDAFLRVVQKNAGGRICWVISGRNDLMRSRRHGNKYFRGYSEDYSYRLIEYNMRQLALDDIRIYFSSRIPDRPLNDSDTDAIRQATLGIPLAMCQAADLWEKGIPLENIVGSTTEPVPTSSIVRSMTERYFLHAIQDHQNDREILYALAIAQGDRDLLRSLLSSYLSKTQDLDQLLEIIERRYSSIYVDESRLHDEVEFFLRQDLVNRKDTEIAVNLYRRAENVYRTRLANREKECVTLEERLTDEEWANASLMLVDTLFALDQDRAWMHLTPPYLGSMAYNPSLRAGYLGIIENWQKHFLPHNIRRSKKFLSSRDGAITSQYYGDLLQEIMHLEKLGWLSGEYELELRSILILKLSERAHFLGNEEEAVELIYQLRNLPNVSSHLYELVGRTMYNIAQKQLWKHGFEFANPAKHVHELLLQANIFLPDNASILHDLGKSFIALAVVADDHDSEKQKFQLALDVIKRCVEVAPKIGLYRNSLAGIYWLNNRVQEAIPEAILATELDPYDESPHITLAHIYLEEKKYGEVAVELEKALKINPASSSTLYGFGLYYQDMDDLDKAFEYYSKVITLPHTSKHAYSLFMMGIISFHFGRSEANDYFSEALEWAEKSTFFQLFEKSIFLEWKSLQLLCQGKSDEARILLEQAISMFHSPDQFDLAPYELIKSSVNPPEDIEAFINFLNEAKDKLDNQHV